MTLTYDPVTGASRYTVQAGTSEGLSNVANQDVGTLTRVVARNVPNGRYFIRVGAQTPTGPGPFSPDVVADVGAPCVPPGIPTGLTGKINGSGSTRSVTLSWNASSGDVTHYEFVAYDQLVDPPDRYSFVSARTGFSVTVPEGQFFNLLMAVRAVGPCGVSPFSDARLLIIPRGTVP